MQYYYYQQVGGNEAWKPIPETKLDTLDGAMFRTILSVDSPIPETADKATFDEIKYKGPLYFDLDDATSPGSTAVNALELVGKLEEQGVFPKQLEIFASGGKGFHILVPEECFLTKPPKTGLAFLPAIFKEMAYELAVESMDFRVYTARRGRMLRCHNVQRPNGLYKVQISYEELVSLVEVYRMSPDAAEAKYKEICSAPRRSLDVETDAPELATGLLALFDQCRTKVGKSKKGKRARPVTLPKDLPSFEALLKGEGIKDDIGFHQLAMQVAIVAHARGMTQVELLDAAAGLCENHESDGNRYNTAGKRRAELARMWEYTEDNPCYVYSPAAITTLLTHPAADFHGLVLTDEEVQAGIVEGEGEQPVDEYGHANVIMTRQGSYALTESGPKLLTALSFDNVVELVSPETNQIAALSADMYIAGRKVGTKEFELEDFNSVSGLNKVVMRQGQAFSGNDIQARGVYMRVIEKARKAKKRMYAVNREGLDFIQIPFHEDEEVQKGFIAWVDGEGIAMEPRVEGKDLKLKFVGFPSSLGSFQTDLSAAPNLKTWLDEESNKEELQVMLRNLLYCQSPAYVGKMLGWTVACFYRMLFHKQYKQFPMLHINGSAGAGKTSMYRLFANFHYYKTEVKMLTPSSTVFAVAQAASGSASIPLILDEFKPSEMLPPVYDKFKLMLRDAYNCRTVEKGGGTRENSDYRSVHRTQLSAPICFIAEAAESESALMERVVLLTLVKPTAIQAQQYLQKFLYASQHADMLGIVGKYMTAQIVKRYSPEAFQSEFGAIYDATRRELMLQADDVNLSAEEYTRKASAKERTVFNYSVAKFGLVKFKNLVHNIYGEEFDEVLNQMLDTMHSTISDIQEQTTPEWLKVMNNFADMARIDNMAPYHLAEGSDYGYMTYNGKTCIELYVRSCYFKYRAYQKAAGSKPLFPSENAFAHALGNLPAVVVKSYAGDLEAPGGSLLLDLQELRSAGFLAPPSKG